jgi:XTP/dITP diphosphohydrolase
MKLIIASNNKKKIIEIKACLSPRFDEILSMEEAGIICDIEETGKTFFDNAYIKAKYIYDKIKDGRKEYCCLADDSGVCVDALKGRPGVHSARYAGTPCDDLKNNLKLMKELEGITDRNAYYEAALVLFLPDGKYITVSERTYGEITAAYDGSLAFGYDPIFYSYDLKKRFSEASIEEKESVSHRGRALRALMNKFS